MLVASSQPSVVPSSSHWSTTALSSANGSRVSSTVASSVASFVPSGVAFCVPTVVPSHLSFAGHFPPLLSSTSSAAPLSSSFSISSLMSSSVSSASISCTSFPCVSSVSFPYYSALSFASVTASSSSGVSSVTWSLPSVVSSAVVWSPFLSSRDSAPTVSSLGSSSVPSASVSSGVVLSSAERGLSAHPSRFSSLVNPSSSDSTLVFTDPLTFRDGEDPPVKSGEDPSSGSKGDSSVAFKEVLALITGLFPAAKPSVSPNVDVSLWFEDFGSAKRRVPRVLLSLFDKLTPVMKDIDEKFRKASDDRKKATSCLPVWGDAYRLGDIKDFHRAPRINKSSCGFFSVHLRVFGRMFEIRVMCSRLD